MDKDKNKTETLNDNVEKKEEILCLLFSKITSRGEKNYREILTNLVNESFALNPPKSYNTIKGWFVSDYLPSYMEEKMPHLIEILCDVLIEMQEDNIKENIELEKALKEAEQWIKKI